MHQASVDTGFCPSTSVFVRVLRGFCPRTSVFVRVLLFLSEYFGFLTQYFGFLSEYFGFCPSTSGFCPSTSVFLSQYFGFLSEYFGFLSEYFGFLSEYFGFPLSVPSHHCSILHLHVAITRRVNERSLGTLQKVIPSRKSGSIGQNRSFT